MILIPGGMTTRNWSTISAPAVSAAASNGPPEICRQVTQGCLAALGRPVPVDEDGMLHPKHDMTYIGGEQTLG
jgi:hypothetical protein